MRPTVSRQAGWPGGQCEGTGEPEAKARARRAERRSAITPATSHAQELGRGLCFCRQDVLRFRQTFKRERNALFDQLDDLLIGLGYSSPALHIRGLRPPRAFFVVVDDTNRFHFRFSCHSSFLASSSARPTSRKRILRTIGGRTVSRSWKANTSDG